MRRFTIRQRVLAAFATVAVLALAAVAVAYWTGGGSGSGSGEVGTNGSVTLTGTVNGDLAPGINQDVSFTAANATSSPIRVTTVHLDSVSVDNDHAGCTVADFSMEDVTEDHSVPAGATIEALPENGSLAYANTAVSQDNCKGASLTLTLSSS